jgi:hypothetical protein
LPNKPGVLYPVASSTLKNWHAFVFSAYGRKFKPPVPRVASDSQMAVEAVFYFKRALSQVSSIGQNALKVLKEKGFF